MVSIMSFLKKIFGIKDSKFGNESIDIPAKGSTDTSKIEYSINPKFLANESNNTDMHKSDQNTEAENECIMIKYLEKYLSDKTLKYKYSILDFPENFDYGKPYSLEEIKTLCGQLLESNNDRIKLSSSIEDIRILDCINKEYVYCLSFFEDLPKLVKLFINKEIKTDDVKVYELITILIRNDLKEIFDENLLGYYEFIKNKINDKISHESIIYAIYDSKLDRINGSALSDEDLFWILDISFFEEDNEKTRNLINRLPGIVLNTEAKLWLLSKFNLSCTRKELRALIEKVGDDIEIENFEKNLGSTNSMNEEKVITPDFSSINGYEFEEFLLDLFVDLGYRVIKTPNSGDQGADLILYKHNKSIVVQAKNYEGKVSNSAIQQIVAAKNYYKADTAMVVTNSMFTKSAVELAYANDVDLWDGHKLREVINSL